MCRGLPVTQTKISRLSYRKILVNMPNCYFGVDVPFVLRSSYSYGKDAAKGYSCLFLRMASYVVALS